MPGPIWCSLAEKVWQMHPAYSVIIFTTASGAGYGLIIMACALALLGIIEPTRWLELTVFCLGLGLISIGLLSSTFHLGRPERAWRAFSQWQTSWLSREGVLAIVTFLPILTFAYGWVIHGSAGMPWGIAGVFSIIGALATVWCTGMIYASLKTIRRWHHPLVAPLYVALSLMTGSVLLNAVMAINWQPIQTTAYVTALLLVFGAALKLAYWRSTDTVEKTYSVEAATGLGFLGRVTPLEPPHTQPNYVMREMGYEVGRKHARRLRMLSMIFGFFLPLAAMLIMLVQGEAQALLWPLIAAASCAAGILIERWLFFAEAEHVVTLYYGAEAA